MSKRKINLEKEICETFHDEFKKRDISLNKIVIFGSYVQGKGSEESDIDVIVISKTFINKSIFERVELTNGIGMKLVKKTKKPFDLLYYSDEEWRNGNSLIINVAKKSGLVIYGKH